MLRWRGWWWWWWWQPGSPYGAQTGTENSRPAPALTSDSGTIYELWLCTPLTNVHCCQFVCLFSGVPRPRIRFQKERHVSSHNYRCKQCHTPVCVCVVTILWPVASCAPLFTVNRLFITFRHLTPPSSRCPLLLSGAGSRPEKKENISISIRWQILIITTQKWSVEGEEVRVPLFPLTTKGKKIDEIPAARPPTLDNVIWTKIWMLTAPFCPLFYSLTTTSLSTVYLWSHLRSFGINSSVCRGVHGFTFSAIVRVQ